MNRKQLTILVVVGVIVGALGLITYQKQNQSWQATSSEDREAVFPDFTPDKVGEITLQDGTNQLSLVVKGDEWTVQQRDNYPADFSKISDLVTTIWELQPVRQLEVGESELGALKLLSPDQEGNTGTLVTFSDKQGNEIQRVVLGKTKTKERSSSRASRFGGGSMPVGRYVRAAEEGAKVFLVEETFSSIEVDPSAWLDTTFFSIDNIRSVAMDGKDKAYQWKVSRETANGEWKLATPKKGETLATNKVSSLGSVFSSPSFNDVITEANAPKETGLENPKVATITTFDDFTYRIQIGKKTSDNEYPLSMEVSADLPPVPEPTNGNKSGQKGDGKGQDSQGSGSSNEKEAAAKKRRKEIQQLHDKLEKEKAFEKWTYLVPSYTVNSVLKKRSELMVQPDDEDGDGQKGSSGAGLSTQGAPPAPGSSGGKSLVPSDIPGVDSSEGSEGDSSADGGEAGSSQGGDEGSAEEDGQGSTANEGEEAESSASSGEEGSSGENGPQDAGSNEESAGPSSSESTDSSDSGQSDEADSESGQGDESNQTSSS